jgi:hypothetical protein
VDPDTAVHGVRVGLEALGGISLVATPTLAVVRRPRIEIEPREWNHPSPWRFATVWIRNVPPPRWIPLASRDAAIGVRVLARFYRDGVAVTPEIPCRWSDRPEPLRFDLVDPRTLGAPAGSPVQIAVPDPGRLPESQVYDLQAGGRWEEVAVAILRDGRASGWGAESYFHDGWHNPAWQLDDGVYDVEVRAEWQGTSETRRFRLDVNTNDRTSFRLTDAV